MNRLLARASRPGATVALLILAVLIVVVTTYSRFSHTWDEPSHMATGLERLDLGTYYYEHQHPPLARMALAAGPYLDGHRSGRASMPVRTDFWDRMIQGFDDGRRVLYQEGAYERVLTLARVGVLPFLLIGLLATYAWARRIIGAWPGVLALFLLATIPPFLGNAGLATLDVPMTGLSVASLLAFCLWLERPRPWSGAVFGALAAAAIMAKFSAIPFLAVSFAAIFLWRVWVERQKPGPGVVSSYVKSGVLATAVMLLVFWACYGFGFESIADRANRPYESVEAVFGPGSALSHVVSNVLEMRLVPNFIPEIWRGIEDVRYHNDIGHLSFLLGEVRTKGWWYYYLVGLGVKTPLPVLIVGLFGIGLMLRESLRKRDWRIATPAVAFIAILVFASVYSSINIGIRHVLILYPLLAIAAAYALLWLLQALRRRALALGAVAAVLIAQLTSMVLAYPDHMAYFNAAAGQRPERILLSADLDWGQDLKRLEQELKSRGIDQVAVAYYGSADLTKHALPGVTLLTPNTPQTGWIAASLWKMRRNEDYRWLRSFEPVARVGKSINLYHITDVSSVVKPFVAELAPGVFMRDLNNYPGSNQVFIVFDSFVAVFDPSGITQAKNLMKEIRARTDKPIRYVINSHFHPDHSAGAAVFAAAGAEVVAAAAAREDFEGWARRDFAAKVKNHRDEYRDFEYAPPTRYLEQPWVLDDGVQRLELTHYGHGHTSGDLVGWLPKQRILLAGDLSTNGQHNLAGANISGWISILEKLRALEPKVVVPGHKALAGPELLDKSYQYLTELRAQVTDMVKRGMTFEQIIAAVDIPFYEKWSGVAVRNEIQHLQRAYAEAGGKREEAQPLITKKRVVGLAAVAALSASLMGVLFVRRRRLRPATEQAPRSVRVAPPPEQDKLPR